MDYSENNTKVKDKGRLILWRKFVDDWKWKNPLHRAAWLWMLMKAAYAPHNGLERGQLYFSIYWAPEVWGMTVWQARQFLKRCVDEGDILWKKGTGGRKNNCVTLTQNLTQNLTDNRTVLGIITLLNYDKYNPLPGTAHTVSLTPDYCVGHTIKKQSKKQSIEVPESPSASGKQPHGNSRAKNAKPEPKRHPETQPTTDHIWQTYKERKGVKPPKPNDGLWNKIDARVREYGSADIQRAWDIFLNDRNEWAQETCHTPQVFFSDAVLTKYLALVNDQSGDSQGKSIPAERLKWTPDEER